MEHIAVKIANIPENLYLDSKVYLKKGRSYSFLCENKTVTPALLKSFTKLAFPDDSVYVSRDYLKALQSKGVELAPLPAEDEKPEKPVKPAKSEKIQNTGRKRPETDFEKVKKQYDQAKEEAKKLFSEIAESGKVDDKKTNDFVDDIRFKLESNDIALILQSITGIRTFDESLHTHSLNVAFLNGLMGRWLKYDKVKHKKLVKTGLLHDVGKLRIPLKILSKPSRLSTSEFDEIKRHSYYAYEIMVNSGINEEDVLMGIIQHHEKLNGTGYPSGIRANEITEFARITAISDIYDATVTQRVHKDSHSPFTILENFSNEGYSELDIKYVKLFISCMIEELKGKMVELSDGSVAKVLIVSEQNLQYPVVEVNGKVVSTSPELYCVSMNNHNVSLEEVEKV
ncbi:MAG: HD domain-containing protein [Oscillospiraceae bacterium]|nr:HD domain-containing protein [Oscillospiraceae bacterium]